MLKANLTRTGVSALAVIAIFCSSFVNLRAAGNDEASTAGSTYADWQVVGPEGGDVRVIAIDPRDKDRLYISTLDGHIHTSSDGGQTWRLLVNLNRPKLILD